MLTLVPDLPRRDDRVLPEAPSGLSFDALRDLGRQAAEAGDLSQALTYHRESLELARESGDRLLIDLATCNCATVRISLGQFEAVLPDLREILMSGRCQKNCFLAAMNLSRAHARGKAPKKALFYAQVARDRAVALGNSEWLVWGYNQLANSLVDESRFAEASKEYKRALALQPETRTPARALLIDNLGYCLMMRNRLKEGMRLAFKSLRWFRALGTRVYEVWPRLDLCYAYVELGRLDRARQHGRRAFELAEESGDTHPLKNALYLLGETERVAGNLDEAYRYFSDLQKRFYPDSPQIADLMVAVDMRQMVNLRA